VEKLDLGIHLVLTDQRVGFFKTSGETKSGKPQKWLRKA
jgi:hypothetical protein